MPKIALLSAQYAVYLPGTDRAGLENPQKGIITGESSYTSMIQRHARHRTHTHTHRMKLFATLTLCAALLLTPALASRLRDDWEPPSWCVHVACPSLKSLAAGL